MPFPQLSSPDANASFKYGPTTFAAKAVTTAHRRKTKKERPASPSAKVSAPSTPAIRVDAKPPRIIAAELKRKFSMDPERKEEARMKENEVNKRPLSIDEWSEP